MILVTDHKPLLAIFSSSKSTPILVANRLARWANILNNYDYDIEYRNTKDHANVDVLIRLPVGPDNLFDVFEEYTDHDIVCSISFLGHIVSPSNPEILKQETLKNSLLCEVI
ncbi:hypothetical protein RF11_04058 [Thelohanellus kitauei]|uniref:Reverse transcriptase RNase H-like domain-containing protein n=1 Tax=Thelohanellus kitauei TaxID=669202 RepID=A0A0C2J161_THEKT|nr:hypothetical protein RF11_04058 [Thelohanellus kitauei]